LAFRPQAHHKGVSRRRLVVLEAQPSRTFLQVQTAVLPQCIH
jgi:hypothetical protein